MCSVRTFFQLLLVIAKQDMDSRCVLLKQRLDPLLLIRGQFEVRRTNSWSIDCGVRMC